MDGLADEHGIVGLSGLDTRSLVLKLRDSGAMRAVAVADEEELAVEDAVAEVARAARR